MLNCLKQNLLHVLLVATSVFSATAPAAQMVSQCFMTEENQNVVGKNIDTLMPIASVSKIYTTVMATTRFNLTDKFYTLVHVLPLGKGIFDVHLEGSLDPYFNKFKMHMIVSKLNELNITKIRNLTFDEKIKYLHETDVSRGFYAGRTLVKPLILKADLDFPTSDIVSAEFMQLTQIMKSYPQTYKLAAQTGIKLFPNPKLSIKNISYLSSNNFKATKQMTKFYVASQDIKNILKSINWNSNNHAANQTFVASGGLAYFQKLYYQDFRQTQNDVIFVNGSGQNHDLSGEGRIYNLATCRNVIKTVRILNKAVTAQKFQLSDIMSVVGIDKGSTVGGAAYSNALTTGSVIAKSGTVGTNVSLAGAANTKTGLYYFMFNTSVKNASAAEASRARRLISSELQKLIKSKGGPIQFKYQRQNPLNDNLENYDEDDVKEPQLTR